MVSIRPEIENICNSGAPVVALETAVLTHGLPRDIALAVYREMTAAVEGEGAHPAPVAVMGGALKVGLDDEELETLACDEAAKKAGVADLPVLCAQRASAGTTVAATLWAAKKAGIPVFATGGIGGVHRGVVESFDISGDLRALADFGGCVVCSGAKIICDLPKTLEHLETLGVTLVGYRTGQLPAFTCRTSGLELAHRVETPGEAARVVGARDGLGLKQSVLVVQESPVALDADKAQAALESALGEAARKGICGAALTPFLLGALSEETGGDSLSANRALLVENARLAARVSVRLSEA